MELDTGSVGAGMGFIKCICGSLRDWSRVSAGVCRIGYLLKWEGLDRVSVGIGCTAPLL